MNVWRKSRGNRFWFELARVQVIGSRLYLLLNKHTVGLKLLISSLPGLALSIILFIDLFMFTHCYGNNKLNVSVKSKLQHPPPPLSGIPRAFDTFAVQGRRKFDYQSLPGGGEFDPHALGVGNLNCTLNIHVKSLVWRVVMGDALLEDFCGKDCVFVANWLRGFCAVFEGI